MDQLIERCAGLDVHKATVTACVRVPGPGGTRTQQVQPFRTTSGELLARRDWLAAPAVTHVAMESTGVDWKPIYDTLEDALRVCWSMPRTSRMCRVERLTCRTRSGSQTFARRYFGTDSPIGRSFDVVTNFPFKANYSRGTFIVRTSSGNPLALASLLRQVVPRARPEFRVSNIRTQAELVHQHTIRERLLATLALFFAGIALLLAGIGLYDVLD